MTTFLTSTLEPEEQRWLRLHDYESLEAWALDSDYVQNNADGEWYRTDDLGGPNAAPVDLPDCLAGAIEAQSCEYEITVSNRFFATDQADAVDQMVHWLQEKADEATYRWERLDTVTYNGEELPHETGVIDAEGNFPVDMPTSNP